MAEKNMTQESEKKVHKLENFTENVKIQTPSKMILVGQSMSGMDSYYYYTIVGGLCDIIRSPCFRQDHAHGRDPQKPR